MSLMTDILAESIKILPLFLIPVLLKKSFNAIPALGNAVNKLSSRAGRGISKQAKKGYQRSDFARYAADAKAGREEKLFNKYAERASKRGVIGTGLRGGGFGQTGRDTRIRAMAAKNAAEQEKIKRSGILLDQFTKDDGTLLNKEDLGRIARGENIDYDYIDKNGVRQSRTIQAKQFTNEDRVAAGQRYARAANHTELQTFAAHVDSIEDNVLRANLADAIASSPVGSSSTILGGKAISDIKQGRGARGVDIDFKQIALGNVRSGKANPEALASASVEELTTYVEALAAPGATAVDIKTASDAIEKIYSTPNLASKVSPGSERDLKLKEIQNFQPTTSTQQPTQP